MHIGSGFVVNRKGLFITAGHVLLHHLNEVHRIRVGFPELENPSRLYKIQIHYHEYLDSSIQQRGAEKRSYHQDLAICRIISSEDHQSFKLRRRRPDEDEILLVKGFYNPERLSLPLQGNTSNLSLLSKEETSLRIKYRHFAVFSRTPSHYEINPTKIPKDRIFSNCLTLRYSVHAGVSGCPVLDSENRVIGILLGGNQNLQYCNVLCSKYIRKRYKYIKP